MISILNAAETGVQQSKAYVVMMNILPFVLIFVIFYFLLIRPQKKKQLAHKQMIDSIKIGQKILLNSGFTGKVSKVKDNGYLVVEIASGVEVEVVKSSIASVITE